MLVCKAAASQSYKIIKLNKLQTIVFYLYFDYFKWFLFYNSVKLQKFKTLRSLSENFGRSGSIFKKKYNLLRKTVPEFWLNLIDVIQRY